MALPIKKLETRALDSHDERKLEERKNVLLDLMDEMVATAKKETRSPKKH